MRKRFLVAPRRRTWLMSAAVASLFAIDGGLAWRDRTRAIPCAGSASCAVSSAAPGPGVQGADELPAGPAVLEFTSEACPACRRMEPVLRDAREQCAAAGAHVTSFDVESTAGGGLAARSGITATPTLILLDVEHREVGRLVGVHSVADVRRGIELAYGVACASGAPVPRGSGG